MGKHCESPNMVCAEAQHQKYLIQTHLAKMLSEYAAPASCWNEIVLHKNQGRMLAKMYHFKNAFAKQTHLMFTPHPTVQATNYPFNFHLFPSKPANPNSVLSLAAH